MASARNGLLVMGIALLVGALLFPLIIWSANSGSFEDFVVGVIMTVIITPLLFVIGLILTIIGMRKGRSGQQQQQQVVVLSGQQARARGFVTETTCPHCQGGLGGGERFCIHCGGRVQHG